jgi:cystine transport system permease protein
MRYELEFTAPLAYWQDLLAGAATTLGLSVAATVLGFGLGVACAIARTGGSQAGSRVASAYVEAIRNTPLLVQIFIVYFGLASLGIKLSAFTAAILALVINVGAYTSEIIRAVLASVQKGQWEAAYSIGMTWTQAMGRIILPQAGRVAVPPLSNTFISLVKDTSLAAAITVPELFRAGQRIVATTYEPLILYVEVALVYLLVSSVLSSLQARVEKRLSRYGGYIEAAS